MNKRFWFIALALVFFYWLIEIQPLPKDCWSNYTTEDEAIMHCEQHHG
jgi:hypothetical protein